ncbi:MAG: methyl-accepting chemotaxis protein [Sulfurospirillaceae bacterium]|nr:methyl-accepting chemotaxis protein [Sulfurospirillaceae bacterium]MDD2826391.1 methyl-accepting chemotaxis protein [Sulfurospirillaceae bacterium]
MNDAFFKKVSLLINKYATLELNIQRWQKGNEINLKERVVSIVEVITMIKDIADRTNFLALNAAIEAARTQKANASSNNLKRFKDKLQSLIIGCDAILDNTQLVSYKLFANLANLEHLLFRVNPYHAIFFTKNITLKNYQHCRFGKWMVAKGKDLFGIIDSIIKEA